MIKRAGIVLAGGRAERFQEKNEEWQDKALAKLAEKPLVIHVLRNLGKVVDDVVVCVNDEARKTQYVKILSENSIENIKVVVDEKIDRLGGPLIAIYTGLKAIDAELCVTLPADMPLAQPAIIEYMFEEIRDSLVVVPVWPNGRLETLNMVLKKDSALEIVETLCSLKRQRSDDVIRGALKANFVAIVGEIMRIDPELKSFVNINSREDLVKLQPRCVDGPVKMNHRTDLGSLPVVELNQLKEAAAFFQEGKFSEAATRFSLCATVFERKKMFFWAALSRENEVKSSLDSLMKQNEAEYACAVKEALRKAAENYEFEARVYEKCGCVFLAKRARSDKLWCELRLAELRSKTA
ncbi:MAG: molybdenum cofactor guanylyltransferase [Candidatus Bathyarchaeota archaeon]|nr:molybdenum cofactor guanylyltransferase [Candidatus Bathyarchaeota archaeon]